ncbi:MAG: TetR/AcrR family transcriptional regulator [Syntrophales bacterium]|jgi:AcrR family transcriptional regulator
MTQILKEKIKKKIDNAALIQFYKNGYKHATMSNIAKEAGIATGGIYRYYHSKDELFYSVIPQDIIKEMLSLIKSRLSALDGMSINKARLTNAMKLVDSQLVEFFITHKMQLIVAIDKSRGTKYENLKDRIRDMLISNIYEYLKTLGRQNFLNDKIKNGILRIIMANFIQAFVEILRNIKTKDDLAYAYESLLEYQELGMEKFLG